MKIKRGLSFIAIFLVMLSVIAVSACSPEDKLPSARVLQPDDTDYPKVNTSPKQIVKFNAIIPDGFSKEFHLNYSVEWKQNYPNNKVFVSPPGCSWTNENQYSINLIVELKQESGNLYSGTLVLDYFLPGECKWQLYSMSSPMLVGQIFYYRQSGHSNPRPLPGLNLEEENIHIWCTEKDRRNKNVEPNPKLLSERIDCTKFVFLEALAQKSPGFYESIPTDEKEWNIHVTQYLKTLKVEFHDLDKVLFERSK